jgi:hypothetical protein
VKWNIVLFFIRVLLGLDIKSILFPAFKKTYLPLSSEMNLSQNDKHYLKRRSLLHLKKGFSWYSIVNFIVGTFQGEPAWINLMQ